MSRAEGFAPVPNWMIRDKSIPRNAILVYASLSSRSGLGGIFPSQALIAEESGLSERTVRTMLNELEQLGVVQRSRRRRKGGRGRLSDGYTLHPNGHAVVDEELPAESAGKSVTNRQAEHDQPATGDRSTGNEAHLAPYIEAEPLEAEPLQVEAAPKRGTRIPDDFAVTPEMVSWARERTPLVDGARSTERFVNYWASKSGKDATKLDWVRTWRNWMLSDQEKAEQRQQSRPSPAARAQSVLEMGAAMDARAAHVADRRAVSA